MIATSLSSSLSNDSKRMYAPRCAALPAISGLCNKTEKGPLILPLEEAIESQKSGAGYIAVGRMFPTATKANTRPAGLETLRAVREVAKVPLVAIGGITEGNVEAVVEAGADLIAVISSVTDAPDPLCAARRLTTRIFAALEKYR